MSDNESDKVQNNESDNVQRAMSMADKLANYQLRVQQEKVELQDRLIKSMEETEAARNEVIAEKSKNRALLAQVDELMSQGVQGQPASQGQYMGILLQNDEMRQTVREQQTTIERLQAELRRKDAIIETQAQDIALMRQSLREYHDVVVAKHQRPKEDRRVEDAFNLNFGSMMARTMPDPLEAVARHQPAPVQPKEDRRVEDAFDTNFGSMRDMITETMPQLNTDTLDSLAIFMTIEDDKAPLRHLNRETYVDTRCKQILDFVPVGTLTLREANNLALKEWQHDKMKKPSNTTRDHAGDAAELRRVMHATRGMGFGHGAAV